MTDARRNELIDIHDRLSETAAALKQLAAQELSELSLIPDDPMLASYYDDILIKTEETAEAIGDAASAAGEAAEYVLESVVLSAWHGPLKPCGGE